MACIEKMDSGATRSTSMSLQRRIAKLEETVATRERSSSLRVSWKNGDDFWEGCVTRHEGAVFELLAEEEREREQP